MIAVRTNVFVAVSFVTIALILISGCKKEDDEPEITLPVVTTNAVSSIASTTAKCGGNVTADGGAEVTARGICWSTAQNPTTSNNKTTNGTGTGTFTGNLSGLTLGTTYYVRAYATNSAGTAYGNQVNFTAALGVGDNHQGGVIAYVFKSGDPGYVAGELHGLIATPGDQSTAVKWNNGAFVATGATSDNNGQGNTTTILNAQGAGSYAAKICADLVLGGYSDWYLPAKWELEKMYLNRSAIGGFTESYYWSSTEYAPSGSGNAWFYCTLGGGYIHYGNKENTYAVRAVRKF